MEVYLNFATEDDTFKNFTITDGLQSNEFNGRACFKDSNRW